MSSYTNENFSSRLFSIHSETPAEIAWLHTKCVSEMIKPTISVLFCQESAYYSVNWASAIPSPITASPTFIQTAVNSDWVVKTRLPSTILNKNITTSPRSFYSINPIKNCTNFVVMNLMFVIFTSALQQKYPEESNTIAILPPLLWAALYWKVESKRLMLVG